jgi:DNA topoisomerase-3
MTKLLTEKKTDLLRGFVSMKKFGRKFSAYLVMGVDGKTAFEFEPRKEGEKVRKPFFKKEAAPEANGHAVNGKSVIPKNIIKAKGGARKRSTKKAE